MAGDTELDRLKAVQEVAFKQKQVAYQKQEGTWSRLVGTKEELNRAFEEKQRAYKIQNQSWEDCQELRSRKGPRIDRLNALQEEAYQNMKRSFDSASAAHERRDGASAKSYSEQGHRYKEEAQDYVEERRELVGELKAAQAIHNDTKPAFNYAKEKFAEVKRKHDELKAEHEKAQEEFKRAKSDFDQAAKTFKVRLDFIKGQDKNNRENNRRLAEKAGIPYQYLDSVKVEYSLDGGTNFFFGGLGKPDGLGHGHYATNDLGELIYHRLPSDPHGGQNFTEDLYWHKEKMAYDIDSGTYQTDNYFGIREETDQKKKFHIAVNSEGDIVYVREINGEVFYSKKDNIGYLPKNLDWNK